MPEAPTAPAPAAPTTATPPTAPKAPTPAPAPAKAPAAAPAPPAPKAKDSTPDREDPFAELDRIANEPTEPKTPATPPKPEPKKETAEVTPPPGDPGDPPAEPPKKIADLRASYETVKKERDTLKAELEAARKGKTGEDPEKSAITERLTAAEKRRQELEEEMRFTRYEKSDEYKTKYEVPMEAAFKNAYADMQELQVETAEGTRKATDQDFNALVRMPLQQAIAQSKEWFGDAAIEVMAHRRKILDLNKARQESIDKFRAEGGEREKKTLAERAQQQEALQRTWNESNESAATKFPEFFAPDDADPEGNELLTKGLSLADAAFNNSAELTPEQRVRLHSMVRNKAGAFDRLVHRNRALQTRLAEAEKALSEYQASEPGKGTPGAAPGEGAAKSWESELDEIARKNGGS